VTRQMSRRYSHFPNLLKHVLCDVPDCGFDGVTCGAHIECIWGHYETANIPLSNGSNVMYFCSVFVKIWFCKILR